MKKFFVALLVFTLAISMSACSLFAKPYEKPAKEFTYTVGEDTFVVTLTEAFSELQQQGFAVVYRSSPADVSVACYTDAFSAQPTIQQQNMLRGFTIADYANSLISNGNGSFENATYVPATDTSVAHLSHTMYNSQYDTTFAYYSALYKSEYGFWIMQFATSEELYDTYAPYFETWAKSVSFNG